MNIVSTDNVYGNVAFVFTDYHLVMTLGVNDSKLTGIVAFKLIVGCVNDDCCNGTVA